MCILSANVLSLGPEMDDKLHANYKVSLLEKQFADIGVIIAGLQEGRARRSEHRDSEHFNMYISSADERGSYGVQVWVAKKFGGAD